MIVGLDIKNKRMKCSHCQNEVIKKYHRLDQYNKVICETCYSKNRRCQVCSLPNKDMYLVDGLKVCMDCYSQKYRCRSCSKDLKKDKLHHIYGLQGFFCSTCIHLLNHCDRCNFPAYSDDKLIEVDREIRLCESCFSTSIVDSEVAKKVLVNVSRILNKKMGLQIVKNLTLELVNKRELMYHSDILLKPNNQASAENLLGFTKRDGKNFHTYIQTGLSLSTFISTATYEYARAWQLQYCSKQIGRVLWEGFAGWTATKILWLLGYHEEILKIERFGDHFSYGLKKIQVIEKSKGTHGVLEFMIQVK